MITSEEYLNSLAEEERKVNDAREAFRLAVLQKEKLEKELGQEYISCHAKFKVGDEVRFAKRPNGRKYIVKDVSCVSYNVLSYPSNYSVVDIRYKVETKNGRIPNGGWSINENELVKVI